MGHHCTFNIQGEISRFADKRSTAEPGVSISGLRLSLKEATPKPIELKFHAGSDS